MQPSKHVPNIPETATKKVDLPACIGDTHTHTHMYTHTLRCYITDKKTKKNYKAEAELWVNSV